MNEEDFNYLSQNMKEFNFSQVFQQYIYLYKIYIYIKIF